jgi:hypothetical protein
LFLSAVDLFFHVWGRRVSKRSSSIDWIFLKYSYVWYMNLILFWIQLPNFIIWLKKLKKNHRKKENLFSCFIRIYFLFVNARLILFMSIWSLENMTGWNHNFIRVKRRIVLKMERIKSVQSLTIQFPIFFFKIAWTSASNWNWIKFKLFPMIYCCLISKSIFVHILTISLKFLCANWLWKINDI